MVEMRFSLRRDGGIYIPLVPAAVCASLHFAHTASNKSRTEAAHPFAVSARLFAGKRAAVQRATSSLFAACGTKGITH